MIIDDLSIFIILEIFRTALSDEETTDWKIAQSFFKCEKDENRNRYLTGKCILVSNRLKKMVEEGIMVESKNEKGEQNVLNDKKVSLKDVSCPDGKRHKCICIFNKNNKWEIYET